MISPPSPQWLFSTVLLTVACLALTPAKAVPDSPAPAASATPAGEFEGYRIPGEFEPQEAVILTASPENPEFMQATIRMVRALQPHVTIKMMLSDEPSLARVREQLVQAGVKTEAIRFSVEPLAMFFMRDGALYLVNDSGKLAVIDLKWSAYGQPGWCERVYAGHPDRIAKCISYIDPATDGLDRSIAQASGASVMTSSLYLENACLEVNGRGVLLVSETLALERNPGRTRQQIERELLKLPGTKKVIWLADGLAQDPLAMAVIEGNYVGMGAGGHTDEFVRFADANTVLLAWADDKQAAAHPLNRLNRERMERNYEILTHATDQDGKPLRVVKVPMPAALEKKIVLASRDNQDAQWVEGFFLGSDKFKVGTELVQSSPASYLNFVVANGLVLVPSYVESGTPQALQDQVRDILAAAFPGRSIQFIDAAALTWSGGGLHCATLSEPRTK